MAYHSASCQSRLSAEQKIMTDSLRLRYNMPLSDLPSKCVRGEKYTVCHALSCKKGGFVAQRHDGICNLLPHLLVRFAPTLKFNHNYNQSKLSVFFLNRKEL